MMWGCRVVYRHSNLITSIFRLSANIYEQEVRRLKLFIVASLLVVSGLTYSAHHEGADGSNPFILIARVHVKRRHGRTIPERGSDG